MTLREVFYAEVSTCASHTKHDSRCNCQRTVDSLLQRMREDPQMVRDWLTTVPTREPRTMREAALAAERGKHDRH